MRRVFGVAALVVLVSAVFGTMLSQAQGPSGVAFPEGYREWVHVKTALVSARHRDFERSGGFRHIYANAKALSGYRTGAFPEGSTIVVDWIEGLDTDGSFSEGPRRRLDVMVKDRRASLRRVDGASSVSPELRVSEL